jgi:sulfur carrier protein ThiS
LPGALRPEDRMAVEVKWFPTLVKRTRSKQATTTVDWRAGLTPLEVFKSEGFSDADAEAVMVVINDEQAEHETALNDGDRLEFMVSIQGG